MAQQLEEHFESAEINVTLCKMSCNVAIDFHLQVFHDRVAKRMSSGTVLLMQNKYYMVPVCYSCLNHFQSCLPHLWPLRSSIQIFFSPALGPLPWWGQHPGSSVMPVDGIFCSILWTVVSEAESLSEFNDNTV